MRNRLWILILFCSCSNSVIAKDFGKQGATFEIKEEGFVNMIIRKLKEVDLQEHEQKMKELARKRVEEPKAVEGITKATKTVTHSYDLTYILDKDVFLPCGKLLYPKGTEVNPLDHVTWYGNLIFIDSRDKEQVAWAIENYINSAKAPTIKELKNNTNEQRSAQEVTSSLDSGNEDENKIVLVAGRPLDLQKEISQPIYFDQFGELTKKFNISHVPAIVKQEGKYLKITEINIDNK